MSANSVLPTFKQSFLHGIASGIGWAFGATIGFAILLAILSSVFSHVQQLPFIGDFFSPVSNLVNQANDPRTEVFEELQ